MTVRSRHIVLRVLIAIGCLLLILGAFLYFLLSNNRSDDVIEVSIKDGDVQSVAFDGLDLVPGDSREYKVQLKGDRSGSFDVSFDFAEKEDGGLKYFARVKVVSGEEILYDALLADAFEDGSTEITVDFSANRNTELTVIYYMSVEIGNEAQNTDATFEMEFSAAGNGGN